MAIVFDLDGVLVDSGAVVERNWRRWAQAVGVDEAAVLAAIHGRPSRAVVEEFVAPQDVEQAVRLVDDWEVEHSAGLHAFPGALACVAFARAAGPWAVVTSGSRRLATARLAAAGIAAPPVLVTADDVAHGKPDPEPYARAADRLGVAPAAATAIEDAPAGVGSARAAGMHVIAVTTTHAAEELAAADLVCDSMASVERALRAR